MDVGAVRVCFVDDLSGDVGKNYEGVVFGQGWDVYDGGGQGERVWGQ